MVGTGLHPTHLLLGAHETCLILEGHSRSSCVPVVTRWMGVVRWQERGTCCLLVWPPSSPDVQRTKKSQAENLRL